MTHQASVLLTVKTVVMMMMMRGLVTRMRGLVMMEGAPTNSMMISMVTMARRNIMAVTITTIKEIVFVGDCWSEIDDN